MSDAQYVCTLDDAQYVCTLDDVALEKARDELYEDPADRLGSVQKFREWILDQKHITCRTGWLNRE